MSTAPHHESNRAFYDRISSAYDLIANANERPARLAGLHALEVQKGEKVLEVGFGTGNEIADIAELVGTSGLVAGIDISPGMLAVAKRKLESKEQLAPLDLRVGDARQLPWDSGSFDAVYTSFTLELFPLEDIPGVLEECKRVLKPGGRVGIVSMATVKPGHHTSMLERGYIWMHRHFPHLVDCQPIDVESFVEKAGLPIVKVEEMTIWTMPVRAVIAQKESS
jgi:demethylmenaquinone methyltransferase/2-methoxy-6-polyprenyl-1,4-benzoquinol methylase